MPEEAITAPSADTSLDAPAADTPNEAPADSGQGTQTDTPDADVINMRADYTRKTQELAQQRQEFEAQQAEVENLKNLFENAFVQQDEEAAQELLESLGYEVGDEDGENFADPEVAQLRSQLDELNSWKAQQEAEKEAERGALHIEAEFDRLGLGSWKADNPEHNAILALAFAHGNDDGPTDIQAGFDQYQKLKDAVIENFKQSKLAPSSDHGSPASAAPLENASLEERVAAAMERNFS